MLLIGLALQANGLQRHDLRPGSPVNGPHDFIRILSQESGGSGYLVTDRGEQLNAVEIEEAISNLADQPFDPENFPYGFLEAFGNKETTIKRLRAGASNKSDLGGVLQTNNIRSLAQQASRIRIGNHRVHRSNPSRAHYAKDGSEYFRHVGQTHRQVRTLRVTVMRRNLESGGHAITCSGRGLRFGSTV